MKTLHKDITTIEAPAIILHGVNCQGRMGSGVAKAIANKWPKVKEEYCKLCDKVGVKESLLGSTQIILIGKNLLVFNCFTQVQYGYDTEQYADINAIITCIEFAIKEAIGFYNVPIYLPKIGCGLGGLGWKDVSKELIKLEKQYGIELTLCLKDE